MAETITRTLLLTPETLPFARRAKPVEILLRPRAVVLSV